MTRDFDARLTLIDSAQAFHWHIIDGRFIAVVDGRVLTHTDSDAFAQTYFDDDRDYNAIARDCASPVAARAIGMLPGLRVLAQPPWETLIAFILSANNNVPRIRKIADSLCRLLGGKHEYQGHALYGYPTPEALAGADAETLKQKTGCGYRAPYLIETAKRVLSGFPLSDLCALPYERAHDMLLTLPGVGDKVADCVLLFGCRHASAFPVDVWVARLMGEYFGMAGLTRNEIRARGRALFGANAGIVQQYLFHAARVGLLTGKRGDAS